jgi:hypothetical protein
MGPTANFQSDSSTTLSGSIEALHRIEDKLCMEGVVFWVRDNIAEGAEKRN